MKRIGGVLLVILGLALAAFGVFRATTAEESTVVGVSIPGGESQFIYTSPGVLSLVDDAVKVTVTAPEGIVEWALATTKDAELYVGDAPATRVVGLKAWDEAEVEVLPGTDDARAAIAEAATSEGGFDITKSDLWMQSGSGEGSVEVELTPDPTFAQSLVATTSTGVAPELTLEWNRTLGGTNPVPFIVIGLLVALIGALLTLSAWQAGQASEGIEKIYRERRARSEAETTIIPTVDDRAATNETTGGAYGAGILPAANHELRERELDDEDRLVIPVAESEPVAAAPVGEAAPVDGEPVAESEPVEEKATDDETKTEDEQDWRSLWNFSWGTPFQKGDTNA